MFPMEDKDSSIDGLTEEVHDLTISLETAERDRQDMAMLIRRLLRKVPLSHNGTIINAEIIEQTKDYLKRKGLTGSILRENK